MTPAPLRVAVVTPHPLVRAGLEALLQSAPDQVTLAEPSDVAVYDLTGIRGPEQPQDLLRLIATTPVVGLAPELGSEVNRRSLMRGIVAVLPISVHAGELVSTLQRAARRGVDATDGTPMTRLRAQREALRTAHGLSVRELDILERIADGLSNQAIAQELYLSPNTVKSYVRSAYRKIGATRRGHAMLWVIRQDLLTLPSSTNARGDETADG